MLLIDALVMVAQEYSEEQGWIISSQHGRVVRLGGLWQPSVYLVYDERGTMVRGNSALEIVLSELIERNPAASIDQYWKIEPHTINTEVSSTMDLLASHVPCKVHQWSSGTPIRVCVKCGFFEVVNQAPAY